MKILSFLAVSIIASGALFAADFSKSSNADLLNMAGKITATEAKDYFSEIDKRVDEMTGKEAREFWETYRANEEKVFDNMKVKDIRAYKQSLGGMRGMPCGGFDKGNRDFDKGAKGNRGFDKKQSKGRGGSHCGENCQNPQTPPIKK